MESRTEKRAAKKAAGLCVQLHPDCGKKALYPLEHCSDHLPPGHYVARWAAERERQRRPASN